eukprot:CAMPEP_0206841342 /NCGR_PEP_ID=MMETSP0975-20121206/22403_1 /ASSEMBLY_ACC=CAM_ASM_000399 /TAXON_ID=483370 /ORGANISM="non described non described, Strain CCMP2097" /LENGTH=98 /DNA_ID=CAMNT_0054383851 /DNA_START=970 /DNA_END=1267 /DNA_ORIENTATION=+
MREREVAWQPSALDLLDWMLFEKRCQDKRFLISVVFAAFSNFLDRVILAAIEKIFGIALGWMIPPDSRWDVGFSASRWKTASAVAQSMTAAAAAQPMT